VCGNENGRTVGTEYDERRFKLVRDEGVGCNDRVVVGHDTSSLLARTNVCDAIPMDLIHKTCALRIETERRKDTPTVFKDCRFIVTNVEA
jgi:hypothetical protein